MLNQTCSDCTQFTASSQVPTVGTCKPHSDRVMAHDKRCTTFKAGGRTMVKIGNICVGID